MSKKKLEETKKVNRSGLKKSMDVKESVNAECPGAAISGKDLSKITVHRTPTGIFMLDMLSGGGIPQSRLTIIRGPKSSGKSTLCKRIAGAHQRLFPNDSVLYVDYEGTWDDNWAKALIPDYGRLHVIQPDYGEQGINWTRDFAKADDLGLIIIDSIAAMIPTIVAESDAEDSHVALLAKLNNHQLRMLLPIMSYKRRTKHPLTLVFVNQDHGSQIGGGGKKFGAKPPTNPGGKMQGFASSLEIKMYISEYKKKSNVPIKVINTFTVDKNKVGIAKRSGEFTYYIAPVDGYQQGDLEEIPQILTYAKRGGVLIKNGSSWGWGGKRSYNNLSSVLSDLETDTKLFNTIKAKTLAACLSDVLFSGEEGGEEESVMTE